MFCGAGGAGEGYHRAGFDVVGVDLSPQLNYPFEFVRADALEALRCLLERGLNAPGGGFAEHGYWLLGDFDAIHASPPCQGYSDLRHITGREYPKLIEPLRALLREAGLPYVIENVEGAPLRDAVCLCGTMFRGLRVLRHRLFESNVSLAPLPHLPHPLVFTHDKRKAHYGKLDQDTAFVQVTGGGNCSIANARDAMGIEWMTKHELNEAIPPAYSHYVGWQLMGSIAAV